MDRLALSFLLLTAACSDQRPPEPTSAEREQLDEAEAMLNELAKEEGPEADAPGPSQNSN